MVAPRTLKQVPKQDEHPGSLHDASGPARSRPTITPAAAELACRRARCPTHPPRYTAVQEGRYAVAPTASYDSIADWYEFDFLGDAGRVVTDDPIGVYGSLRDLLGPGAGTCADLGCGTGVAASVLRQLGWSPIGFDLSSGMLRHARRRLPVAQADATRLPVPNASVAAAVGVMVHTDLPDYAALLAEAARILRPDGVFVHVGVHPCFCGGFADRTDPAAVIIQPGYLDGSWTKASWTDRGVRARVGATHLPLPQLLEAFVGAGLVLERFTEGGAPVPTTFGVRARRR